VMSGTSLDGLDLCYTQFTGDVSTDVWSFRIEKAITIPYTDTWKGRLSGSVNLNGADLIQLHVEYGHFVGQTVRDFIKEGNLKPDFVASHGHTVFHQVDKGFTFQLGEGETTSIYLTCPFITNFRSKDLALGGQGAPLVPSGERFLFSQTDICLNLGGIANIGLKNGKGYDICPCNIVFNRLAGLHTAFMDYDEDGKLASRGKIKPDLLDQLNDLDYYKLKCPKSLGIEWISAKVFPLLDAKQYTYEDMMRTLAEHVAQKIAQACVDSKPSTKDDEVSVMITGGGAFNKFLIKILSEKLEEHKISIKETDEETINFKEALVFAFLGLRSLLGRENVCSDVTGSTTDTVSGSIH
ncbi:hypothetical protein LOTGIDRAFT_73844, partial [Lottia gigantea]